MLVGDTWIEEFDRDEFLAYRWAYRTGDHVTFIAPTDYGKTTLTMQLLEHTATRRLPVFNLAGKPKDDVMSDWTKRMGYQLSRTWPAARVAFWRKPAGYTIWPPHTGNEEIDDPLQSDVFRRVMRHCAKKGKCIINTDEFGEMKELGLDKTTRAIHRRGRSNGAGLWGGIQGPTHAETHAYSQAQHLFLGNTPDKRHRDRFGEIGGVDPDLVRSAVVRLPDFHWLYLRRRGRVMCIIGP